MVGFRIEWSMRALQKVTLSNDLKRVRWEPCKFCENYKVENYGTCKYTQAATHLGYSRKRKEATMSRIEQERRKLLEIRTDKQQEDRRSSKILSRGTEEFNRITQAIVLTVDSRVEGRRPVSG